MSLNTTDILQLLLPKVNSNESNEVTVLKRRKMYDSLVKRLVYGHSTIEQSQKVWKSIKSRNSII